MAYELFVSELIDEGIVHLHVRVLPLVQHVPVLEEIFAMESLAAVPSLRQSLEIMFMAAVTMVPMLMVVLATRTGSRLEHHECSD